MAGVIDLDELVMPYTMTSPARVQGMVTALEQIDRKGIKGDVVECGVWRGGNIILARLMSPDRVCWLYDTFAGMTKPDLEDITKSGKKSALDRYCARQKDGRGWCVASLDDVKACLSETHTFDEARLRFVCGDVRHTLLDSTNLPERIALLRLDTDWYASTNIELEVLYPRLVDGGFLIVDDYGHWQGARRAVDEYFGDIGSFRRLDYSAIMKVKGRD